VRLLILAASSKIVLGAAAALVARGHSEPIPNFVFLVMVGAFATAGGWLVVLGRADRRAVSLGIFFLLVATSFTVPPLTRYARAGARLAPLAHYAADVPLDAYLPFFLWLFVRDFPRARRVERRGWLFRATVNATLALGTILLVVNVAGLPGSVGGAVARALDRNTLGSLYFALVYTPMGPAMLYSLRQARRAPPDEQRRVWIVVAGLAMGVAPIATIIMAATLIQPFGVYLRQPGPARWLGFALIYPSILSVAVVTTYAVLAHRALDLRRIMRRVLQYGLARHTLGLLAAVPLVVLLAFLYSDRGAASLASRNIRLAFVVLAAAGFTMLWLRPRLLEALDRRFFREQYDSRRILSGLVEEIRTLRTRGELAAVLAREIDRALHLRFVETFLLDSAHGVLAAAGGGWAPLSLEWRLAGRIRGEGGPLEVGWGPLDGWAGSLPAGEQQWLADLDVRLLVPVPAADGSLLGVLALGEKRSDLPFSDEDRLLLSAIAHSVALVVENRGIDSASRLLPDADLPADSVARECRACGLVLGSAEERCARCGGATEAALAPLILAGKFRVLERIGAGGMGVVYRGVDLSLGRDVAIKTLPSVSPRDARWLRKEARAMAAVSHPNLALIFGAESWHGAPMLIVEYLRGGTLAERISAGKVPAVEAVSVVDALVPALACLHDAAILHRDIKPSNIGFAGDGTPKLLDFGLARALEAAKSAESYPEPWRSTDRNAAIWHVSLALTAGSGAGGWGGTLLYLPPEAADGESPSVSWDLWALGMVLYEIVAGRHPLAGGTPYGTLLRIAEADIPDLRELDSGAPPALAGFLREALHADRRKRPASARELGQRLRALSTGLV
jgi:hypothetical protein